MNEDRLIPEIPPILSSEPIKLNETAKNALFYHNPTNVRQFFTEDSQEWCSIYPQINSEKKTKLYPPGRMLVIIYILILTLFGPVLLFKGFVNEYNTFMAIGLQNLALAVILLISLRVKITRMAELAVRISQLGVLLFYWYIASIPSNSHFSYPKYRAPADFLLPYITALNIWISFVTKNILKTTL